ncbi:MAG: putative toxin-antitoxin system toxin component, PIN family [Holophagaceae bacterium]|uniref:Toxin-antitoxin system toxin component, PIN family n=1 Tax=Candidatus Geothrix skivensis TaxID=2954439 RepID=A0A9D7SCL5_9BACT|nr:putative toxin-antitoxin system toxin component, PIN family [Candidatus Geothrix skivensis]
MRLIVLDTNVIVSAGINPGGATARIVMDWVLEGQVQVVTSPWIVAEYREVMQRAKFRRHGFPPQWLGFLVDESLHLPEPDPWLGPIPDAKDGPFLALAQAAGAWLVSGNLKHLPESARKGVKVLSPVDFLAGLEGS